MNNENRNSFGNNNEDRFSTLEDVINSKTGEVMYTYDEYGNKRKRKKKVYKYSKEEASRIVKFAPKASAELLEKLLNSAIANAENNHFMNRANLYVAEIYANQGPTLKRIRPAAKGSAVRIRKRTSHITIVLRESK